MKSEILTAHGISKQYPQAKSAIFQQLNVSIYQGDFTVIMGPSGAGKSTLLYALSGLDSIDDGEIQYRGQRLLSHQEKQMAKFRSEDFGFVFQQTHLISNLTLFENIVVAGLGKKSNKNKECETKANELLQQTHLDEVKDHMASQVSGGEAQRAAIARAMMNNPTILFADEPTGALNRKHSDDVLALLQQLHSQGQSILMVTHDTHVAASGNRILYLEDGSIVDELDCSPFQTLSQKEKEQKINDWLQSKMW